MAEGAACGPWSVSQGRVPFGAGGGGLGSPLGEGAAQKLVWCNSNLVSGISVGIALCVLPE